MLKDAVIFNTQAFTFYSNMQDKIRLRLIYSDAVYFEIVARHLFLSSIVPRFCVLRYQSADKHICLICLYCNRKIIFS